MKIMLQSVQHALQNATLVKQMPQHVWIAILHRIENSQETPVNAKTLITMMELIIVNPVILNAIPVKQMLQHVWIAILHRIENCQETPVNARTFIMKLEH